MTTPNPDAFATADETPKEPKAAATAPATDVDLSAEIIRAIDREADDRVTCRRIYGNNYRCNWWSAADTGGYDNPAMYGLLVTTHRVRKSRFLWASRTASGLVIRDPKDGTNTY
jgi:hypothetical protein